MKYSIRHIVLGPDRDFFRLDRKASFLTEWIHIGEYPTLHTAEKAMERSMKYPYTKCTLIYKREKK